MVESGIGLVRMYQDICGYLSSQNFPEVSSKKSHEQQTVAAQDVDRWAYQATCLLFNVLNRLKQDRRRIESDFFSGKLCGIAATNALELGIDVGHIDVTLHLGFPGSIASLWQQAGRSGRRERPSLAIYVAFEGPLDQYFMKFPQKLFRRPIECCHVDAQNQQVLEQHLVCAALEHPLSLLYDEKYFGSGLNSAITSLTNRGYLSFDPSRGSSSRIWNYIGHAVYDGAVYMHQGKTYLVKELDISRKLALCQQADLKYYTKTRDFTDIHVIGGSLGSSSTISKTAVEIHRFSFRAGLHAASHAVLNVVPLYVICNSSDLAPECSNPHDTRYIPERILLYDPHPGGTGFSAQASDMKFSLIFQTLENRVGCCFLVFQVRSHFTELLTAALELLMSCCCTGDTGCPNCIQNLACGEYNELLHKDAAIMIIKGVLEAEESYFGGHTESSKP
ncbi:ATP-dependent helicase hrq1 [Vitis vinifera]|uniref:ATP-dependent helicase hrq1 n=1 Tax=Vitis vinifera TaxID=29760 RepID=A0A438JY85_VITVI|nr:ATP-dependent helicase hrq1 [Vitis vinifera]